MEMNYDLSWVHRLHDKSWRFNIFTEVKVMPKKLRSLCKFERCPELTEDKYCDKHKTLQSRYYNKYKRNPDTYKSMGTAGEKSGSFISKDIRSADCANEKVY